MAITISGGVQLSGPVLLDPTGSSPSPSPSGGGSFQGSNYGYTSGGDGQPVAPYTNVIQKFSFTSDGNATDVGDLTVSRAYLAGQSSSVSGYSSGGYGGAPALSNDYRDVIDKFPFSSDSNATDVGDLLEATNTNSGNSSSNNGYSCGGAPSGGNVNIIQKFPFASDSNATDAADLLSANGSSAGQNSSVSGYQSGGSSPYLDVIQKFPFSSDSNATDVGDLVQARSRAAGQSSTTHGYASSGTLGPPSFSTTLTYEKFAFASDGNASNVGNITGDGRSYVAGQSSTTSGYNTGGSQGNVPGRNNIIDKFPTASDADATDVGDLTLNVLAATGQQY